VLSKSFRAEESKDSNNQSFSHFWLFFFDTKMSQKASKKKKPKTGMKERSSQVSFFSCESSGFY